MTLVGKSSKVGYQFNNKKRYLNRGTKEEKRWILSAKKGGLIWFCEDPIKEIAPAHPETKPRSDEGPAY